MKKQYIAIISRNMVPCLYPHRDVSMRQEQLMTKPLDGIALQTYFRRLNLQKDAQDQLIAVRSSPPSRLPDSRAGNMPVWYPSKKMQCIMKAESAKVEFAFLLEAEHDDEVIEFWDQPPPIELIDHDRRGHLQQPLHTADYFVFRYQSAGWEECKPVEKMIQIAQQHSKSYVLDEHGQRRWSPLEGICSRDGLYYIMSALELI